MNPFFNVGDRPFDFSALTVARVEEALSLVRQQTDVIKQQIIDSPVDDVAGRLLQRDELWECLDKVMYPAYLLKETSPDDDLRDASQEVVKELFGLATRLNLDEDLFRSLDSFSKTEPNLSPIHARYLKKNMDDYLRNGFLLSAEDREILKGYDDEINALELVYQKNLAACDDSLELTEAQSAGLPEDFKQTKRRESGTYHITCSFPDYRMVMIHAQQEDVRQAMYRLYLNRARSENLELLHRIIKLRYKKARLLGFPTYAALKLESVMAEKPERVWDFFSVLSNRLAAKSRDDFQLLCKTADAASLAPWNRLFYTNIYKERVFHLDEEELRLYFPLERVGRGLFELARELYGIEIDRADLPVWHEDVRAYEVREDGNLIARFYLDMFPRANKFSHAACFGLQSGRQTEDGYQIPVSALVCNFPAPTADRPSLLTHKDVETFFHEFGHLMHRCLTRAPLGEMSGTSVARDFVEMPSQIMERWVWEKEPLRRFARHYQTDEPIPDDLLEKLFAVKNVNSGIDYQQQLFYAALDMTLHDGPELETADEILEVNRRLQREYTLFEMPADTCFPANFEHLLNYGAGYYGYLWSRVYADDMFSVFLEKGLFSREAGQRFRDGILALGDTEAPMKLIESFLGRAPGLDAFLENLGIPAVG